MSTFPLLRTTALGLALLLALPLPAPAQTTNLPALGDGTGGGWDITAERRVGDRIMREVRRDPDYFEDPLLEAYVDALWQPLLASARARGDIRPDSEALYAWQTFLIRDKVINAFALPGGYVGLYLGLMAMTTTRDELASVLAHELTHVTQRHIARGLESGQRQQLGALAATILGLLAASRSSNPAAAQAVVMGGQAAALQGQINFTREMEREADRIGFDVLAGGGYSGAGMSGMFEKMDTASRLNDNNQYPYLRTHPLTIERISEARLRVREANPPPQTGTPVVHALMQARARVFMDTNPEALRHWQTQGNDASAPATDVARLAARYGAALASAQLREWDRAATQLDAADALATRGFADQPDVARALALARVQMAIDQGGNAITGTSAQTALRTLADDASRPAVFMRAAAALALQRAGAPAEAALREVLQVLQNWTVMHRTDAAAWQWQAQCADALNLPRRAQRAGAEAAYARGDVLGAYDRLRVAQALPQRGAGDEMDLAVVNARLRDLEPERRRVLAEARGEKVD
ncbi:MAG: M48 family metalloprotease [Proteobacteria bacterium]|nr:M48 family metalloprotease [Pseudomonadota bacterium]